MKYRAKKVDKKYGKQKNNNNKYSDDSEYNTESYVEAADKNENDIGKKEK